MAKMKTIAALGLVGSLALATMMIGCNTPNSAQQTANEQNQQKMDQAAKMMKEVAVPTFNHSVERENIAKRLQVTNDANTLQWIYPTSAGRVLGRFPVRGKVTSGSKRLTSTQQVVGHSYGTNGGGVVMETPDETGAYGSSAPYVFWFDPAGNYHQWQGDYFMSPMPYQIEKNYGTVSVEIDQSEVAKKAEYDKQTASAPKK